MPWYKPNPTYTVVIHTKTWNFLGCYALLYGTKAVISAYEIKFQFNYIYMQNYIFLNTHHNILFRKFYYIKTLYSLKHYISLWGSCDILSMCYCMVSSRVGISPFLREPPRPPFLATPSFWSKFKKFPHSFWEPSRLVDVNCKKHFKMKVLCFVLFNNF